MYNVEDLKIQWFPGHMTKAKRMMQAHMNLVDIVIEMLDARIPYSSSNPMLTEICGTKTKIVVLNKADLVSSHELQECISIFKDRAQSCIALNSAAGTDYKKLLGAIKQVAKPLILKWEKKGVRNKTIRVMIAGIPNVGKSSLINRMVGKVKARTGDTPGVTKGEQWLKIADNIELLDTPGILWPKFEDKNMAWSLAMSGAIKDDIFDREQVVKIFLQRMSVSKPQFLQERFALSSEQLDNSAEKIIEYIAHKRGCLRAGGIIDSQKVVNIVLREYRDGKIGKFILDNI